MDTPFSDRRFGSGSPVVVHGQEQPLPEAEWIEGCLRALRELLPTWSACELASRASVLWLMANCMAPQEAAEIAATWWGGGR